MNAYLRAAQTNPFFRQQAIDALEKRRQKNEVIEPIRACDDLGRFVTDDPETLQNEAWVQSTV